jgi:hypothetical protein
MKKGWKIFSIFFIIISVSIGITAGILISNFRQIKFELHDIIVDDIQIRDISVDLNMRFNVSIISPAMSFSGEGGTFSVKVEGVHIGNGEIGSFQASPESNELIINFNATIGFNATIALAIPLIEYLIGSDLEIEITIKTIIIIVGISLPLNFVWTRSLNINDN